jgi:pyrroline-5-carboxylate reductase
MMAQALVEPMVTGNVQPASGFTVYDVNVATMERLSETHGVKIAGSIQECVQDAELVICAVKPQNLTPAFFEEMAKGASEDSILLSVIAGKSMKVFTEGGFVKIVRSMPNTPASIGQGMTVWSATENLNAEEREKIRTVLTSCGKSVRLAVGFASNQWNVGTSFLMLVHISLTSLRCTWTTSRTLTWQRVFLALVRPTFLCSWKA